MHAIVGRGAGRLVGAVEPSLLRDELLGEIFETSVKRTPQHIAIIFGAERLTYAELDARADKVARALRARGVAAGSFVGLWMSRSLDLHVALLGILKAGAAYIPFDADAPPERIGECLADCEARLLIIDDVTRAKLDRDLAAPAASCRDLLAAGAEAPTVDPRAEGVTPASPA
jgi:non-ribosomal peptide synthetase component F